MWNKYDNYRTVRTLKESGATALKSSSLSQTGVRTVQLETYRRTKRTVGANNLAQDVIVLVGALRYGKHRSVPESHEVLQQRGLSAQRSVGHLLDRYDD